MVGVSAQLQAGGSPADSVGAVVRLIGEHAREVNQRRAADIAAALARDIREPLQPAELTELADLAHQVAGSAGTFGFADASGLASSIERMLAESALGQVTRLRATQLRTAQVRVRRLCEQLAAEPDYDYPDSGDEHGTDAFSAGVGLADPRDVPV
ncbi:MAG: hypothetical protein JWP61_2988 [Friedmanniella sp.]|nr:hypothetical protein [Friedmanniella sp.]